MPGELSTGMARENGGFGFGVTLARSPAACTRGYTVMAIEHLDAGPRLWYPRQRRLRRSPLGLKQASDSDKVVNMIHGWRPFS